MGWNTLFHPNILPLLGATMSDNRFMMVSEWMTKGNINEFVEANPNADRLGLVCFYRLKLLPPLVTDGDVITVACRCYSGVDLHA